MSEVSPDSSEGPLPPTDPGSMHDPAGPVGSGRGPARQAGQVVNGKYKLERRLDLREGREQQQARGAFGEVWKALYLIQLGRPAETAAGAETSTHGAPKGTTQQRAVKFIQPERADLRTLKRFTEIEPKALARLSHPYIARFYEIDWHGNDPFLAMEFVRGGSITSYTDQERLTLDQRVELVIKVCEALQHVHNQGLVHRDLKPDNILVTEVEGGHGGEGTEGHEERALSGRQGIKTPVPKLIDFGLAKSTSAEPLDRSVASEVVFVGTRPYASPEQFSRRAYEEVDRAADVYALGAILFELLCGVSPMHHVLSDPRSSHLQKEQRCASEDRPTLLAAFDRLDPETQRTVAERRRTSVRALRRAFSGSLQLVQGALLRVEPKDRISDVSHLREDLRNYLDGQLFRYVRKEPWLSRTARRVRRNPLPYAATAAVILALLLGLAGTYWQKHWADVERENAKAAEAIAQRQATIARQRLVISESAVRSADDPAITRLLLRELPEVPQINIPNNVIDKWLRTGSIPYTRCTSHADAIFDIAWSSDSRSVMTWAEKPMVWAADGIIPPTDLTRGSEREMGAARKGCGQFLRWVEYTSPKERECNSYMAVSNVRECKAVSPDGRRVAQLRQLDGPVDIERGSYTVEISDVVTWGQGIRIETGKGPVNCIAWSPDGRLVAVGAANEVQIWPADRSAEEPAMILRGHAESITCIMWSPDGQSIAAGAADSDVRIWHPFASAVSTTLLKHDNSIMCISWSPDSTLLATGSEDGTGRVWDVERGVAQQVLRWHIRPIMCISFSPDGRFVATGSEDSNAAVWQLFDAAAEVATAAANVRKIIDLGLWNGSLSSKLLSEESSVYYKKWRRDGITNENFWQIVWPELRLQLWTSTNLYLYKNERIAFLGEDESTAAAHEAEDLAWIEKRLKAHDAGLPPPPPPRGEP